MDGPDDGPSEETLVLDCGGSGGDGARDGDGGSGGRGGDGGQRRELWGGWVWRGEEVGGSEGLWGWGRGDGGIGEVVCGCEWGEVLEGGVEMGRNGEGGGWECVTREIFGVGMDEVEEVGVTAGGEVVSEDETCGPNGGLVEGEGGGAVEGEAGLGCGAEVMRIMG